MNLARVDFNLLVVFDAIARTGSVKDAAPDLGLSQPAVSHALNRLRELIGDPLFVRSHNKLVPTERAEAMKIPVGEILQSMRTILQGGRFDAASATHTFKIAISDFTALAIIPKLLQRFRQDAPNVALELIPVSEHTLGQLEMGTLDCTFWGLRPPEAPFCSQLLFRDNFVVFCCAQHPLIQTMQTGISLEDYLAYPHAIASFRDPNPSPVDVFLAQSGRSRTIALRSSSFMSNITAIPGTDVITTLPSKLAPIAKSHGLRCFSLPFDIPDFPYSLVWHRRTDTDPASRWIRTLLTRGAESP